LFRAPQAVKVTALVYYASRLPDLDESLILDVLEGFAYGNDRQVEWKDVRKAPPDKQNPRVELIIEPVPAAGEWWRAGFPGTGAGE
jgi:hypothetical protein